MNEQRIDKKVATLLNSLRVEQGYLDSTSLQAPYEDIDPDDMNKSYGDPTTLFERYPVLVSESGFRISFVLERVLDNPKKAHQTYVELWNGKSDTKVMRFLYSDIVKGE